MVKQKVKIINPSGLHLHPAGHLCDAANGFECRITFVGPTGNISNAKSLLSILGAAIKWGDELEFICEGSDEVAALAKMVEVIESGFENLET